MYSVVKIIFMAPNDDAASIFFECTRQAHARVCDGAVVRPAFFSALLPSMPPFPLAPWQRDGATGPTPTAAEIECFTAACTVYADRVAWRECSEGSRSVHPSQSIRRGDAHVSRCDAGRRLAMAMALHPRLGAASPAAALSPDLMRRVCALLAPMHTRRLAAVYLRTDLLVDRIELRYSDFSSRACGGCGGTWREPLLLMPGESICRVNWWAGDHLDALRFHMTTGRMSAKYGGPGGTMQRDLVAPPGQEIIALRVGRSLEAHALSPVLSAEFVDIPRADTLGDLALVHNGFAAHHAAPRPREPETPAGPDDRSLDDLGPLDDELSDDRSDSERSDDGEDDEPDEYAGGYDDYEYGLYESMAQPDDFADFAM